VKFAVGAAFFAREEVEGVAVWQDVELAAGSFVGNRGGRTRENKAEIMLPLALLPHQDRRTSSR